jgi:hypothetical protein
MRPANTWKSPTSGKRKPTGCSVEERWKSGPLGPRKGPATAGALAMVTQGGLCEETWIRLSLDSPLFVEGQCIDRLRLPGLIGVIPQAREASARFLRCASRDKESAPRKSRLTMSREHGPSPRAAEAISRVLFASSAHSRQNRARTGTRKRSLTHGPLGMTLFMKFKFPAVHTKLLWAKAPTLTGLFARP